MSGENEGEIVVRGGFGFVGSDGFVQGSVLNSSGEEGFTVAVFSSGTFGFAKGFTPVPAELSSLELAQEARSLILQHLAGRYPMVTWAHQLYVVLDTACSEVCERDGCHGHDYESVQQLVLCAVQVAKHQPAVFTEMKTEEVMELIGLAPFQQIMTCDVERMLASESGWSM